MFIWKSISAAQNTV